MNEQGEKEISLAVVADLRPKDNTKGEGNREKGIAMRTIAIGTIRPIDKASATGAKTGGMRA